MIFKSIKQLSRDDIETIFSYCSFFFKNQDKNHSILDLKQIATIFFEPSTRTQLSFQRAIHLLGGKILSISDIAQTRSNSFDAEKLTDALKVISFYCDCLVFRSRNSLLEIDIDHLIQPIHFINAGDGRNEHPLQALGDCWLLSQTHKDFKISFGFVGDCTARVFRSVFFLLTMLGVQEFHYFSTNVEEMPSDILNLNEDVKIVFHDNIESFLKNVDIIEVIPYKIPINTPIERKEGDIAITEALIKKYNADVTILHPGPRNFELCPSVDQLKNSLFFEQAQTSTFMKMAVLKFVFT